MMRDIFVNMFPIVLPNQMFFRAHTTDEARKPALSYQDIFHKYLQLFANLFVFYPVLDMICKKRYDLIFLDHMMPNMDGIETIRIHKKNYESIHKTKGILLRR